MNEEKSQVLSHFVDKNNLSKNLAKRLFITNSEKTAKEKKNFYQKSL
jgi:hypothetical protein